MLRFRLGRRSSRERELSMAQIRVSDSSQLLEIKSEPYVVYTKRGYQPAIDIESVHTDESGYLLIGAQSLSDALYEISQSNGSKLSGVVILIRKESKARISPYIVSRQ
jgi:hypothetical protein